MEITYPSDLLSTLNNKHLLLDTNVFRDAVTQPVFFTSFFNVLKKSDVTLATIDLVKYELLTGSATLLKFKEKEQHIKDIIDVTVPILPQTYSITYELIQQYGIDGAGVCTTDLLLGSLLKQYNKGIFLLTRDTSDFIKRIFELTSIVNCPHAKGIFTYGVYSYKS